MDEAPVDIHGRKQGLHAFLIARSRCFQKFVLLVFSHEDDFGRGIGEFDGGFPVGVANRGIRSVLKEDDTNVDFPLDGRLVKRRVVPVIARVGISAVLQQQFHHLLSIQSKENRS